MRIATFNLESFGDDGFDEAALAPRIERLRPVVETLAADVLCLQEVNAQRAGGKAPRRFAALDALLSGTAYEGFHRASSVGEGGTASDKHNLVIVSRFPVRAARVIRNDFVAPPAWRPRTATGTMPAEIAFDRPILQATLDMPDGRPLHVFNLHLRAPIAAPVPGQKLSAVQWKSVAGWAEGYYLAAMKRVGQALELRQAIDAVFDEDPQARILAAGDFNAVTVESALRIVLADAEDTGNRGLAYRSMAQVETRLPARERYTVLHHGRPHMLDHILASRQMMERLQRVSVLNEGLADEMDDAGTQAELGSFHAPLVADFSL